MARRAVDPLELIRLKPVMALTTGAPEITVGMLDGPVATDHPNLAATSVRANTPGALKSQAASASGPGTGSDAATVHGTFVAGILIGRRGSAAPAICPGCTLLVHPIFGWPLPGPGASPGSVASAMVACIEGGARVVNLSAAVPRASTREERELQASLDFACRRGVIVVAAGGNQGTLGSSAVTRHPWVVPVSSCGRDGRPTGQSTFGSSVGTNGVGAPGEDIISLGPEGSFLSMSGTSFAAAFVTGAAALLWSLFPEADAGEVKHAILAGGLPPRRRRVVPPILDAWAALTTLNQSWGRRWVG